MTVVVSDTVTVPRATLRRMLEEVETIRTELAQIDGEAKGLRERVASSAHAAKGEIDHLIGRVHLLGNRYYGLQEEFYRLIGDPEEVGNG